MVASLRPTYFRRSPFTCQGFRATLVALLKLLHKGHKNNLLGFGCVARKNVTVTFIKKARGRIEFVCQDGLAAQGGVEDCLVNTDGVQFDLFVTGRDAQGEIVSEFVFNWSVKARMKP